VNGRRIKNFKEQWEVCFIKKWTSNDMREAASNQEQGSLQILSIKEEYC
jgi:hypothetical protein